ncbi:hypothetical protein HYV11_02985 [Candidatus Dependentiae bacterium]|nr:hypothetical protein [Candidatus Dependentiae bacterium]
MINKFLLLFLLGFVGLMGYIKYNHSVKIKDLDFVYQQLCDNHPGFYNEQDFGFKNILQQGYNEARSKILELYWWQNHIVILKKYLEKFNDSHLRIYQDNVTFKTIINNEINHNISVELFSNKDLIVHLPTFMLNEKQEKQFKTVIDEISKLDDLRNIVFDLRYNSGGNSELGTQILKAVFGKDYVEQQLYELYQNQTVWWRASKGNSNYLYELVSYFSKNKELYKDVLSRLAEIAKGVSQSLKDNKIFFIEKESNYKKSLQKISCPIRAKIIVVIDKTNVSAALDFITELKALSKHITFIGHKTDADTIYMEVRTILLPSKYGTLQFPIKMYHNRPRKNNQNYSPDIICPTKNINDEWILSHACSNSK